MHKSHLSVLHDISASMEIKNLSEVQLFCLRRVDQVHPHYSKELKCTLNWFWRSFSQFPTMFNNEPTKGLGNMMHNQRNLFQSKCKHNEKLRNTVEDRIQRMQNFDRTVKLSRKLDSDTSHNHLHSISFHYPRIDPNSKI